MRFPLRSNGGRQFENYENKKDRSPRRATDFFGADSQIRTGDLILTKDALYLLSYISKAYAPFVRGIVATEKGLEPSTSGVTGRRSNRLSYSAMVMWL